MSHQKSNAPVLIAVAMIGALGAIGAAAIQPWLGKESARGAAPAKPASTDLVVPSPDPLHSLQLQLPISVKAVHIGALSDEAFVSEKRTVFGIKEEIAVTVRYSADEHVRDFPVRLTAVVSSVVPDWGSEESTTDISVPGDSFSTFRFAPRAKWAPGKHLVRLQVDGRNSYTQVISVE